MKATLIRDLLTDLLDAAVAVLDSPPDRQFVAFGGFAHDCELVAVQAMSVRTESSELGAGFAACAVVPVIPLRLTVVRCYPSLDSDGIPAATALTDASLGLADDAVAITGGLLDKWSDGTLFPTVGVDCDRVEIGTMDPVGPSGGYAGWRITFDVRT